MRGHDDDSAETAGSGAVARGAKHATGTKLHPLRVQGRERAARALAEALGARTAAGDAGSNYSAIARRFAINKNVPAFWCDPKSGVAPALGDVLGLGATLAREVLTRALATLDEGAGATEQETVADLTIALGRAVEALTHDYADNGKVDQHTRHAQNFARIAAIALRGYLAAQKAGSR